MTPLRLAARQADAGRPPSRRPRVVVVGAGFGGLAVTRALRRAPVDVLVVDRHNYHLFQPLLYQVATAGLEPADIAYAARGIVRRWQNADFLTAEVRGADLEQRHLRLAHGGRIPYDHLVVAAGATTATFGVPGVSEHAFGLKSIGDAVRLRSHILELFERCYVTPDLIDEGLLNFVVVGGGPTGVEMAGSLSELIHRVLKRDYPRLEIERSRVIVVEMADEVLAPFAPSLREHAARQLARRGIELRLGSAVRGVAEDSVELSDGVVLPTFTVLWAAGVQASPLASHLKLPTGRAGRIEVDGDLSVRGCENVWAIGDIAAAADGDGKLYPQLAPVAMQGGRHVAEQIVRQMAGTPTEPFRYRDKGTMATIGRRAAVAQLPFRLRFTGTVAWLMWLFLHLVTLIGFRNRLSVLLNWAWSYLTWDRAARLILPAAPRQPEPD